MPDKVGPGVRPPCIRPGVDDADPRHHGKIINYGINMHSLCLESGVVVGLYGEETTFLCIATLFQMKKELT